MTIEVRSNEVPEPVVEAKEPKKEQSAPEAEVSQEQKKSSDSEAEETEADEVSDESDEESDKESDDDSDRDKPKKKGGFQRRIDKLNAAKADAEREREYWKQQALKGASETNKEDPKVESKPANDGRPIPDDFETHADYVDALTDWKMDQRESKKAQEQEKSKLLSEHETLVKSHQERLKSFTDKTADFEEVLENLDGLHSPVAERIILESESGPELLYELAKNPEEAKRICSLSPLAAARELGKIEARLTSKASPEKQETKKITKAPKPIEPVGGSKGSVAKSIDDPDLSQAEYEKLRAKQMKERSASF